MKVRIVKEVTANENETGILIADDGGLWTRNDDGTLRPFTLDDTLLSTNVCLRCGQWFSAHNDDGSCVED